MRLKFNQSLRLFYAREEELRSKDYGREKKAVAELARAQTELLNEGAAALRAAGLRAEQLSKLKLRGNYAQYFSLLAESARKRLEALDAMRARTELWLSDEPHNRVTTKLNEASGKIESLNKEADELEQKAERIRAGQEQ